MDDRQSTMVLGQMQGVSYQGDSGWQHPKYNETKGGVRTPSRIQGAQLRELPNELEVFEESFGGVVA